MNRSRQKVAVLADFPVRRLPGWKDKSDPGFHYATWLPQVAAAWQKQTDFEIHWLVVSSETRTPIEVSAWNQTFHLLPARTRKRASLLYWEDRRNIRQVLQRISPNLVHAWGTEDVYAWAAVQSELPVLLSMQGILSHYGLCRLEHPKIYFQAVLELFCLWRVKRITVESGWGKQILQKRRVRCPIDLVEYGVEEVFFYTSWEPNPAKPSALFIGSLVPRKGIQDLIEAFQAPEMAPYELWVVGSGSDPKILSARSKTPRNIRWLGRVSHDRIPEILKSAWCLVLPTRADTSPNVVKEARVVGLPVLTTECGGQASYLKDQRDGFAIVPGDIQQLTECLLKCLGDYSLARQMGKRGQEAYRELLRPEKTGEKLLEIYREMLDFK